MSFRFVEDADQFQEPSGEKQRKFRFSEEKPSRLRSVLSAAPKGFIKELREQLSKTLGFLPEKLGLLEEGEDVLPISDEEFFEKLEKHLPTQEGFAESALERGGRIAPYALLGGGNPAAQALRSATAGFLGEGAKEAGLPEWVQAIAELPAFAAPSLGKQIIPKKGQKELVAGARKLGLGEEEIAPLIQSEKKQKFLGKITPRRGRTKKLLDKSYQALGRVYNRLENLPISTTEISPEASHEVLSSIQNKMKEFPSGVRKIIEEDFIDLATGPITGASLTNFFKDINYYFGKGFTQLGLLKEPIFKALENISPDLANDYRLTNKLASQYYKISQRLKPNLVSDLFGAGEAIRLITGISLGNLPMIGELVGEQTMRQLGRELLLNPRFQNLSKKMVSALNNNKYTLANQIAKEYADELDEFNPEIAKKIREVDFKTYRHKKSRE